MMLELRDIYKAFGRTEVLKGVSLSVEQGDVVAILGPSGSGKTTLLRCINFLERADRGTMVFDGETLQMDRATKREIAQLRQKTAFVFQNYNLFLNKTALQNVTEGLIVARKVPKAQAEELGMQMLSKVGMADRSGYYPSQLSGGQQQRVSIARALAGSPSVILADEPTGALDSRTGREVLGFLKKLNREGDTVVLITHDNSIAVKADRIVRLQDGKIIYDGDAHDPRAVVRPEEMEQDEPAAGGFSDASPAEQEAGA